MNPEQILDDLHKSYINTVVGIKTQDHILPLYVTSIVYTNNFYFYGQTASSNNMWVPNYGVPLSTLDLTYPECGAINHKQRTYYVTRPPARQWKKGLDTSFLNIKNNFIAEEHMFALTPFNQKDPEFIYNIFNKKFDPPQTLFEKISTGKILGGAINSRFFLAAQLAYKNIVVIYKNYPVGFINNKITIELYSQAAHLAEELAQYYPVNIKD